jgi:protein phosphatase
MSGPSLEIVTNVASDVGCVRELNEDSVRVVSPHDADERRRKGILLVVADGMGGHSAGEVASGLAVDAVHRLYFEGEGDAPASLLDAFLGANRRILEEVERRPQTRGMGTTCTALVIRGNEAHWAHVGDSRLYLVRAGRAYQLTQDHSAVALLVAAGEISREEARHHGEKNVLVRALGTRPDVVIDAGQPPLEIVAGDRFLLTSDGLHDQLTDDELGTTVATGDPAVVCAALVAAARSRGGPDNITVALAEVRQASEPAALRETGVWNPAGGV